MASKFVTLVCLQFAYINVIQGQCLNRMPGLFPGNMLPPPENILPNPVLLPNYPAPIDMERIPYGIETIIPNQVTLPTTTIIQDSTVANNLANALQLLVVSNLLSNTLPTAGEVLVPNYGPDYGVISPIVSQCGYSPYNYIY